MSFENEVWGKFSHGILLIPGRWFIHRSRTWQIDNILQNVCMELSFTLNGSLHSKMWTKVVWHVCQKMHWLDLFRLFFNLSNFWRSGNNNTFVFELWVISVHRNWTDINKIIFIISINENWMFIWNHPNIVTDKFELLSSNWEIYQNFSFPRAPSR